MQVKFFSITIGSPAVNETDVLVAMNRPSLEKFEKSMKPGSLLLMDSSIEGYTAPEGIRALSVPALQLATEGGSARASNTAMVGVLAALAGGEIPDSAYEAAIANNFAGKDKVIAANIAVFHHAKEWATKAMAKG